MRKQKNELKLIDAPVYGYWSTLYQSFYSRRVYVDVGKRWRGLGILYLLFLASLCSIPFFIQLNVHFNDIFKQQITDPLSKIPEFYIQNGEIVFDKPMPYFIKNDQSEVVAVLDNTGKINDFSAYPKLAILINKNQLSIKIPRSDFFSVNSVTYNQTPLVQVFDKGTNMVFDGKKLAKDGSLNKFKYLSQAMVYPALVAILFSTFLAFFMVLGLLGQVFSTIFLSFKISFAQSVRLLVVSGTPMLILLFSTLFFHVTFFGLGFILLGLLLAYYYFAIYSLRAESKQVAHV